MKKSLIDKFHFLILSGILFLNFCAASRTEVQTLRTENQRLKKELQTLKKQMASHQKYDQHVEKMAERELYYQAIGEIKAFGTALLTYVLDHGQAPDIQKYRDLKNALVPRYISKLPYHDPWGVPYHFQLGGIKKDRFRLGSGGSDKQFKGFQQSGAYQLKKNPGGDIVFDSEQTLIHYPI
jgi:hypothetical protein